MATDAEAVYRQLGAPVLGYLRATGRTDAEDLLGDVFLQVTRDLPAFRDAADPVALRRWVFTIARNRVIDAARRDRRRPQTAGVDLPDGPAPMPVEAPDPKLVAGLQGLTVEQREVLALRFVADLPLEDVARLTGRTTGAVKAMQHRALEQLRSAVSPAPRSAL